MVAWMSRMGATIAMSQPSGRYISAIMNSPITRLTTHLRFRSASSRSRSRSRGSTASPARGRAAGCRQRALAPQRHLPYPIARLLDRRAQDGKVGDGGIVGHRGTLRREVDCGRGDAGNLLQPFLDTAYTGGARHSFNGKGRLHRTGHRGGTLTPFGRQEAPSVEPRSGGISRRHSRRARWPRRSPPRS